MSIGVKIYEFYRNQTLKKLGCLFNYSLVISSNLNESTMLNHYNPICTGLFPNSLSAYEAKFWDVVLLSHMKHYLIPRRVQFTASQYLFSFQGYKGGQRWPNQHSLRIESTRSKLILGVSGPADKAGGDSSSRFINFWRVSDKIFKEWQKIGGGRSGRVGDNNILTFCPPVLDKKCHCPVYF